MLHSQARWIGSLTGDTRVNAMAFLRNWRNDLTGLEQVLLAISVIGGAIVALLPEGAQGAAGAVVVAAAAIAAGIDRFLGAPKP